MDLVLSQNFALETFDIFGSPIWVFYSTDNRWLALNLQITGGWFSVFAIYRDRPLSFIAYVILSFCRSISTFQVHFYMRIRIAAKESAHPSVGR